MGSWLVRTNRITKLVTHTISMSRRKDGVFCNKLKYRAWLFTIRTSVDVYNRFPRHPICHHSISTIYWSSVSRWVLHTNRNKNDMITRIRGRYIGRNASSAYKDLAWAVGTAKDTTAGIEDQTIQTLAALDNLLQEQGSHRSPVSYTHLTLPPILLV